MKLSPGSILLWMSRAPLQTPVCNNSSGSISKMRWLGICASPSYDVPPLKGTAKQPTHVNANGPNTGFLPKAQAVSRHLKIVTIKVIHSNTSNYFKRLWNKNHTDSKVPYGLVAYFTGGIKEKTNMLQQQLTQHHLIDIMVNQRLRNSSSKYKPLSLNFAKQFSPIQHYVTCPTAPLITQRPWDITKSPLG